MSSDSEVIAGVPIPPTEFQPLTAIPPTIPDDTLYEVIDGQIVEKRRGARETEIASILVGMLTVFLKAKRLGKVVGEMLFRLDPGAGPPPPARRCIRFPFALAV